MGLGLYIGSPLETVSPPKRRREIYKQVAAAIDEAIDDPLWKALTDSGQEDGKLYVRLHPNEEPAEFSVTEQGFLLCSAKTNSAGPGYHAMLVELLEKIERPCGLHWRWDDPDREFQDETGFHQSRDYRQLQREMAQWLRAVAEFVLKEGDMREFSLAMPMGDHVVGDYFAVSPLGYWTREWFEKVAAAEPDALLAYGAEFFPWWKRERDAVFWRNCGLVQAWVDLPWHPPYDEDETAKYRLVLDCFDRAKELEPQLPLPETEIEEIRSLLGAEELPPERPNPQRIGFRRRPMKRVFPEGWQIDVPGYFYEDVEDDGETLAYWYGDRTVRVSTYSCETEDGKPVPAERLIVMPTDEIDPQGQVEVPEVLEHARDGCLSRAEIRLTHGDDEDYWTLQAATARTGRACIVTITYSDPADKEWALETWKSVFLPENEDTDA